MSALPFMVAKSRSQSGRTFVEHRSHRPLRSVRAPTGWEGGGDHRAVLPRLRQHHHLAACALVPLGLARTVRLASAPLDHALVQDLLARGAIGLPLSRDPAPDRSPPGQLLLAASPSAAVFP